MKNTTVFFGLLFFGILLFTGFLFSAVVHRNYDASLENTGEQPAGFGVLVSGAQTGNARRSHADETYEWASEIREGERESFRGLSVTLVSVEEKNPCERNCLRANLLFASGGASDEVFGAVGDVFSFGGVTVKVSQLAPFEAPEGVVRRAVLLFSGVEE